MFTQDGGRDRGFRNDIQVHRALKLREGDGNALMLYLKERQAACINFNYLCEVDDEGRLKSVFWSHNCSLPTYRYLDDVISSYTMCLKKHAHHLLVNLVEHTYKDKNASGILIDWLGKLSINIISNKDYEFNHRHNSSVPEMRFTKDSLVARHARRPKSVRFKSKKEIKGKNKRSQIKMDAPPNKAFNQSVKGTYPPTGTVNTQSYSSSRLGFKTTNGESSSNAIHTMQFAPVNS